MLEKFVEAQAQENLIRTDRLNFVKVFEKSAVTVDYVATKVLDGLWSIRVFQLLVRAVLFSLLIFQLGILGPVRVNGLDIVLYFG